MTICVLLSWKELTFEDFNQGNLSDQTSGTFLIISILILCALPVYMIITIINNFETLSTEETLKKIGHLYLDLAIETKF